MRSSSSGVIGLPSKTTRWFSEGDIKKLSQVIMDVEKQLRETHTTRTTLEEQNQESITSVSELYSAEPFRTSQSYLWRPEPCTDYDEDLKHTRRKNKHEEDKRFKPPDLNQERHQDITCFILIKEAPPDVAYKPKPS
ncbi:hypothetical protein Bca4012_089204 [Brassica carinata]